MFNFKKSECSRAQFDFSFSPPYYYLYNFVICKVIKAKLSSFLPTGSYTIQGRRVRVYQPEFEDCWALGLVSQHDPRSHIMEIAMDKVHNI